MFQSSQLINSTLIYGSTLFLL